MIRAVLVAIAALIATSCGAAPTTLKAADPRSPLRLEHVIVLPGVKGRIDHLALDLEHRRLFVAEYRNGTVDEIDLANGRLEGRILGLHEPQGVAYLGRDGEIVVACGDGSVHFYSATDRHEVARIDLHDDADNVRIDERNGYVIVGYGKGGLATIDPETHRVIGRMELPGHPEGFRLVGARVLINVPDRGAILAGDVDKGKVESTWSTGSHRLNFPLSVAPTGAWFAIAYRLPAALAQFDSGTGKQLEIRSACGDADDLFIDGKRIFLVCGAGHVDVMPTGTGGSVVRVATGSGARTGLFSAELHTLFVAVPSRGQPAAIWVLRTEPAH
ncbi:MAG TPA: WD40 repeat domain-containing protein [Acetobacteraceae bacterium]|nr:WD40 repeat domain-containing protein [Acetobacteraceae bacterium]